jgi:hydrogenase expression/formation protein HypE
MDVGKLTNEQLNDRIFKNLTFRRDDVMIRPSIGEDCAAIDFGEYACVLSTDPITGTKEEVGKLSVHIASNDIATMGVAPIGLMMTILAPTDSTVEDIEYIIKQANEEAKKLNIEIIGGHTEITKAVNQVIVSMTAVGRQSKDKMPQSSQMKADDLIVITKFPGIEGTGIIAHEKKEELKSILTPEEIQMSQDFLNEVSVIREGQIGSEVQVSYMHDITEGGLLGGLWEVCELSNLGCEIDYESIEMPEVTKKICDYYNINPLKLISSGSMLMTVDPSQLEQLKKKLEKNNINYSVIGRLMQSKDHRVIHYTSGATEKINSPKSDELYKVI